MTPEHGYGSRVGVMGGEPGPDPDDQPAADAAGLPWAATRCVSPGRAHLGPPAHIPRTGLPVLRISAGSQGWEHVPVDAGGVE